MKIFVRPATHMFDASAALELEVEETGTVANVLELYSEITGRDADLLRLMFGDKLLDPGMRLSDTTGVKWGKEEHPLVLETLEGSTNCMCTVFEHAKTFTIETIPAGAALEVVSVEAMAAMTEPKPRLQKDFLGVFDGSTPWLTPVSLGKFKNRLLLKTAVAIEKGRLTGRRVLFELNFAEFYPFGPEPLKMKIGGIKCGMGGASRAAAASAAGGGGGAAPGGLFRSFIEYLCVPQVAIRNFPSLQFYPPTPPPLHPSAP